MECVERIKLTHVRIPLKEPFRISNGVVAEKDGIVVEVDCDGLKGWGESSPMAGSFYSADTPESCWRELVDCLAPAVAGRRFAGLDEASGYIDGLPGSNFAKVGLETAFWDLEAKRRGLPLWRLLGGEQTEVESGLAVGLYETTAELCAAIDRQMCDRYKRVKIKIARGKDMELVRAVRATFGDVPLMTDANADYSAADFGVFEAMDGFGLLMFEQPLGARMLAESAELQRRLRTPVCLDESLEGEADVERAGELRACRVANIKIQRVGGLRNALRVYELCRKWGMDIWVGTMPELGIGSAQGVALATLPGCNYPTDVEASARWFRDDVIEPGIEVKDGLIRLPEVPGLGWEVSAKGLEKYKVAEWEVRA
jgi:o-succinylbenzoate synthase